MKLTAPTTPGIYHYGACVDPVAGESDTTNNCSASVEVAVQDAVTIPHEDGQGPSVEVSVEVSTEDDKEWAPVGDTVDLSARVLDEEGAEVAAMTVTWSSSNTAVATVDSSGVMTAVGAGEATGKIVGSGAPSPRRRRGSGRRGSVRHSARHGRFKGISTSASGSRYTR